MNQFKQNHLMKIHKELREKKQRIKKEFVDTGDADSMIDILEEKRKPSIDVDNLPF